MTRVQLRISGTLQRIARPFTLKFEGSDGIHVDRSFPGNPYRKTDRSFPGNRFPNEARRLRFTRSEYGFEFPTGVGIFEVDTRPFPSVSVIPRSGCRLVCQETSETVIVTQY